MAKNEETSANAVKKQGPVTFYLYDENDVLVKRTKIIYSPFNEKSFGRSRDEDTYRDPEYVTFEGGVFITEDPKTIEFLDAWTRGAVLSNGKKYKGDGIHRIKRERPTVKEAKSETVTVTVETVPSVVAESMTVDQLKVLCQTWKVQIPENITGEVKEAIVKALSESGHISQ